MSHAQRNYRFFEHNGSYTAATGCLCSASFAKYKGLLEKQERSAPYTDEFMLLMRLATAAAADPGDACSLVYIAS